MVKTHGVLSIMVTVVKQYRVQEVDDVVLVKVFYPLCLNFKINTDGVHPRASTKQTSSSVKHVR